MPTEVNLDEALRGHAARGATLPRGWEDLPDSNKRLLLSRARQYSVGDVDPIIHERCEINHYRGTHPKRYERPTPRGGFMQTTILPELVGLPLTNLALSLAHGFDPERILVTTGVETTEGHFGRTVRFTVDENDIIESVRMDISVLFGSGYEVQGVLRNLQQERDA